MSKPSRKLRCLLMIAGVFVGFIHSIAQQATLEGGSGTEASPYIYQVTPGFSVTPPNGTVMENQVGNDLPIEVTVYGVERMSTSDAVLHLWWTDTDSPLLTETFLETSEGTFDGNGRSTLSHTFSGDHWSLDTTGVYSFVVYLESGNTLVEIDEEVTTTVGGVSTTETITTYYYYYWSGYSYSFSYNIPVNGEVPTSQITYPQQSASFVPGKTITISAEASDPDGHVTHVDFLLGNNTGTWTGDETYAVIGTDEEAPFSIEYTIPGEGEYKVSILAYDEHGNSTRSEIVTFYGSHDPFMEYLTSAQMLTPLSGSSVSVLDSITFQVDVQPTALRELVSVDYFVDGYKVTSESVVGSGDDDLFDFEWDGWVGSHTVTARAQLYNGNYVDTINSSNVTVVGIGSDPEVQLSVTGGFNRVVGSDAQFSIHAADSGALITALDFYVNGTVFDSIEEPMNEGSFPWIIDYHFPLYGIHEFYAIATFSNGNRGRSNVIQMDIEIGSTPSVRIVSPVDNMKMLPGTDLPIIATATDRDSLISELNYYVNDNLINTATRSSDGSFDPNPLEFSYNFAFAGSYQVYVQATDGSGVIAQSETVTVNAQSPDPNYPEVLLTHPLPVGDGDTINDPSTGSDMYINAQALDANGSIERVNFYINSVLIGSSSASYLDTFAYYYKVNTPGTYVIFAEAVDNEGNRIHSTPLPLQVESLEAQLPRIELVPLLDQYKSVEVGSEIAVSARVDGGLVQVTQVNFYVDGVFVDTAADADENDEELYTALVKLEEPGTHLISARVVEVEPLSLPTDNWAISDTMGVLVTAETGSRDFVDGIYRDILGVIPSQEILDAAVAALDSGQKTRALVVYEIMESDAFAYNSNALMSRYLLTGAWPTRDILLQDITTVAGGIDSLVSLLLPTFQSNYWSGERIPDTFSSDGDIKDFFKILFQNKYGEDPDGDQSDRGVSLIKLYGAEDTIAQMIEDNEAVAFGSGTISTVLAIPNPPNTLLVDRAYTASLFCNLLKVQPTVDEVEQLRHLSKLEQIQSIMADSRY